MKKIITIIILILTVIFGILFGINKANEPTNNRQTINQNFNDIMCLYGCPTSKKVKKPILKKKYSNKI